MCAAAAVLLVSSSSYAAPSISAVISSVSPLALSTRGMQIVTLRGLNFGPALLETVNNLVVRAAYPSHSQGSPHVFKCH